MEDLTGDTSEDKHIHQCPTCQHTVLARQPYCSFCGTLQSTQSKLQAQASASKLLAHASAFNSQAAFQGKHRKHEDDPESAPIMPTFVYDPARRICVDIHNPHVPGTEPPDYTPNPLLINWKLPQRLDASDKARLQAIQSGLGLLYEAVGKGESCEYPANGIQKATPWGQLTTMQRAMATLERELAFAAYTTSPMQLKPGEAKRRLGTANIPFPTAEQHATRKEVLEYRRDERVFGGAGGRRQPHRASSSSSEAGDQHAKGADQGRGTRRGGNRRRRRGDPRDRSRDNNPRGDRSADRNPRARGKDKRTDNDNHTVAGDGARAAMLSRIADLEKASSRRKPGTSSGADKSGGD